MLQNRNTQPRGVHNPNRSKSIAVGPLAVYASQPAALTAGRPMTDCRGDRRLPGVSLRTTRLDLTHRATNSLLGPSAVVPTTDIQTGQRCPSDGRAPRVSRRTSCGRYETLVYLYVRSVARSAPTGVEPVAITPVTVCCNRARTEASTEVTPQRSNQAPPHPAPLGAISDRIGRRTATEPDQRATHALSKAALAIPLGSNVSLQS